jgi:hypothetical protein
MFRQVAQGLECSTISHCRNCRVISGLKSFNSVVLSPFWPIWRDVGDPKCGKASWGGGLEDVAAEYSGQRCGLTPPETDHLPMWR